MGHLTDKLWAVVPAAGIGTRMRSEIPKQYLPIHGRSVLSHTLERLATHTELQAIVVALAADDPYWAKETIDVAVAVSTVVGGEERCHSVLNALEALAAQAQESDWVMVHDAARPCVRNTDLRMLTETLRDHGVGGLLAVPVRDTMKRGDHVGHVLETVNRGNLWHALTPQMFRYGVLYSALQQALESGILVTDESSAIEAAGLQPLLVPGHADNIKITQPEDLDLAAFYLHNQAQSDVDSTVDGIEDGG